MQNINRFLLDIYHQSLSSSTLGLTSFGRMMYLYWTEWSEWMTNHCRIWILLCHLLGLIYIFIHAFEFAWNHQRFSISCWSGRTFGFIIRSDSWKFQQSCGEKMSYIWAKQFASVIFSWAKKLFHRHLKQLRNHNFVNFYLLRKEIRWRFGLSCNWNARKRCIYLAAE